MNQAEELGNVIAVDTTESQSTQDPPTVNESNPNDEESASPAVDSRYPLTVLYCPTCTLPAELHEYHNASQFEK